MSTDDDATAATPEELMDGIFGRFISASNDVRVALLVDVRKVVMQVRDRRAGREDARLVLQEYLNRSFDEDRALDLLGFGEPSDPYGPRARR